ncbi:hypothetical protein L218DRAFT_929923 [Marasmius fiardii PR-910]|nr:hypothetical protein L218DRAFT_929923 [Marasmius fiardii PR-910]
MTRLGIDIAAVSASRWAASKSRKVQTNAAAVAHSVHHHIQAHQSSERPLTDVENLSNSPVAYGFPHERPLSRVAEESGSTEMELESRDVDERSMSSESELEEELEDEGFYAGSYSRIVVLYSLAPITFLVLFIVFALIPGFHGEDWKRNYPYAPYLPFPVAELLVSGGAWSIAYSLNDFIFRISVWLCGHIHTFLFYCAHPPQHVPPPLSVTPPILVSGLVHATLSVFLRLSTIPILLIPQGSLVPRPTWREPVYGRVWWAGLGWAVFEALAGIKQGYQEISLYRDVLIDVSKLKDQENSLGNSPPGHRGDDVVNTPSRVFTYGATTENNDTGNHASSPVPPVGSTSFVRESGGIQGDQGESVEDLSASGRLPRVPSDRDPERQPLLWGNPLSRSRESIGNPYSGPNPLHESVEIEVERDLGQLIAIQERDDLERVYGIPFIRIPVFISCLQRVNSLLLSMGYTLVLSAVYIRSVAPTSHVPGSSSLYSSSSPTLFPSFSSSTSSRPSFSKPPIDYLKLVVPVLIVLQFLIYVLHSEVALPRLGVHTVVYVGLLVSLSLFFLGLGFWDAVS